jgi:hypothetical protein
VRAAFLWALVVFIGGCAFTPKMDRARGLFVHVPERAGQEAIQRFAPVFVTYHAGEPHNRIGSPMARYDERGFEEIVTDPEQPVIFYGMMTFGTDRATYSNLIYRVHFPEVPSIHLSAGRNVGLLVLITLSREGYPVLVTTVNTCGCYVSITPTNYLPQEAYPPGWQDRPQEIYGETLPHRLDARSPESAFLMVHVRPDVHRVMHLEFVKQDALGAFGNSQVISTKLVAMETLERLPLGEGTTSFYYGSWPLRGHVKGALKVWETLFLSWMPLDLFVGMDKAYGDRELTGNPFYTSLKPWNRKCSDMGDFGAFLRFYGWRL